MSSGCDDLAEAERCYRTLFDQAPFGVLIFDRTFRVTGCNEQLVRIAKGRRESILGFDLQKVSNEALRVAIARALSGISWRYDGPYRTVTSGEDVHVSLRVTPVTDEKGAVVGGMLIVEDCSERELTRRALEESEARFRALIEHAPDAIGVVRNGVRIYGNQALARLHGYDDVAELLGKSMHEQFHPDDLPLLRERLMRPRASGEVRAPQQYRLLRRDGETILAEISSMVFDYDGAPALLCHLRDVTERARLQAQVLQSDRMASIGTLAAGVAHEINNPLAYVMANVDVMLSRKLAMIEAEAEATGAAWLAPKLAELRDMLEAVRDGTERVRDIVRDLRTFSRHDERERGPIDVRRVLDAAIHIAWNEIRHRARLVKRYAEVPYVDGNESRLGQVFLNLLVNAAQSFGVTSSERDLIEVAVDVEPGGGVAVSVRDTGCGMDAATARRVFDPFFTTKPHDAGTGLGLSIARDIVVSLGGSITVESELSVGTTFRVVLPRAVSPRVAVPVSATRSRAEAVRARVLVIDDEPGLAAVLRDALADRHDVAIALGGREAIEILGSGRRFDVIVCDLMMPGVSGIDVYEHVAREHPELQKRVVFVSGGAFTTRVREFLTEHAPFVLEKPFELEKLLSLVQERLEHVSAVGSPSLGVR